MLTELSLLTVIIQQENESIEAPVLIEWAEGIAETLSVEFTECVFMVRV